MKPMKHMKSGGNILCLRHTKHKKHTKCLICLTHMKHMKHMKINEDIVCPRHMKHTKHKKHMKIARRRRTAPTAPPNMDYIRTMGKLESGGATAYVNRLIEADRRKHADVYRQMKTLRPDA